MASVTLPMACEHAAAWPSGGAKRPGLDRSVCVTALPPRPCMCELWWEVRFSGPRVLTCRLAPVPCAVQMLLKTEQCGGQCLPSQVPWNELELRGPSHEARSPPHAQTREAPHLLSDPSVKRFTGLV